MPPTSSTSSSRPDGWAGRLRPLPHRPPPPPLLQRAPPRLRLLVVPPPPASPRRRPSAPSPTPRRLLWQRGARQPRPSASPLLLAELEALEALQEQLVLLESESEALALAALRYLSS